MGSLFRRAHKSRTRHRLALPVLFVAVTGVCVLAQPRQPRVSGTVVSDDGPVRDALVTLAGDALPRKLATQSDEAGRFAFVNVPAGTFAVSAAKPGYLGGADGMGPTRPVTVPSSDAVSDLVLRLQRGGVITGFVTDRSGAPVADVPVSVVSTDDRLGAAAISVFVTSDQGSYRAWGLAPGSYWVVASPQYIGGRGVQPMTVQEVDAALRELQTGAGRPPTRPPPGRGAALAPTVYSASGGPIPDPVVLRSGEERGGINLSIGPVPAGSISGTIVGVGGTVPQAVTLVKRMAGPVLPLDLRVGLDDPVFDGPQLMADGSFRYGAVARGRYTLVALAGRRDARGSVVPDSLEWATSDVDVSGADVSGITLALHPTMRFEGRLLFVGRRGSPPDLTGLRVVLKSAATNLGTLDGSFLRALASAAVVNPDGTFAVHGLLPGRYRVGVETASGAPLAAWTLQSVVIAGRPLDPPEPELTTSDLTGAILTMVDIAPSRGRVEF